ncbi:PQQ-binding-like beta-propeller repeat protein [Streptomyces sp. NPDC020917]|uniref:beta-alanine-activating enzyme beta-propeller domain-containing protein n=1 Tax=Streptomyces sp. NPDC020917 TaxID=3365102 RepID=UPI0037B8DA85
MARLGAGGMGQVFLARSPAGRPVAVKVVRPELGEDGEFRRRFAREVAAARRVNGAFTAGVVDADPDGSPAWLATVYVPGVPLGEAVAAHGPWPARSVLALGAGLVEALEAIHAAGVVHRDLKPSNVLLASDGPRVIDFGISAATETSMLTRTGTTMGTPGFMSPEQLTGDPVGPESDVFSLGELLAYTATGTGPFGTGSAHALSYRTVHEQPDLDGLPPELRAVVADCLAKRPGERPTVPALLDRLTAAGSTGPEDQGDTATLLLGEPDWMPDRVARLVQENTATALPQVAPPVRESPSGQPPSDAAPAPAPAPAPAGMHEAPTRTGTAAAFEAPGPSAPPGPGQSGPGPSGPSDPPGPPAGTPAPPQDPPLDPATELSRRRALIALTGVAAAGVGVAVWSIADNGGSGSPSGGTPQSTGTSSRPPTAPPAQAGGATPRLDAGPGEQRWAFETGDAVTASPVVAEGVVYVGSNDHLLYAVDALTGSQQWVFRTRDSIDGSVAVAGDAVYVGSIDFNLYAVDTASGSQRWTFPTQSGVYSSPAVAGGLVYFGSTDYNLYALDVATGTQRWAKATKVTGFSSPVVDGGVVYVLSDNEDLYTFDAKTGDRGWMLPASGDVYGDQRPVVAGGMVYFGRSDGRLYAVDLVTGKERWRFPTGGPVHSSPVLAGGTVYIGSDDHHLYAVDARTGGQRWAFRTNNWVRTTPAVAGGVVYVGNDGGNLYAVDAAKGRQRWTFHAGGPFNSSPAVAGNLVYIGSDDHHLYAVQR